MVRLNVWVCGFRKRTGRMGAGPDVHTHVGSGSVPCMWAIIGVAFDFAAQLIWQSPQWMHLVILVGVIACVVAAAWLRQRSERVPTSPPSARAKPTHSPRWGQLDTVARWMRVIAVTLVCVGIGLVVLMYAGIFQAGWHAQWAIWLGISGLVVGIAAIPIWELGNRRHRQRDIA